MVASTGTSCSSVDLNNSLKFAMAEATRLTAGQLSTRDYTGRARDMLSSSTGSTCRPVYNAAHLDVSYVLDQRNSISGCVRNFSVHQCPASCSTELKALSLEVKYSGEVTDGCMGVPVSICELDGLLACQVQWGTEFEQYYWFI
jgi:hypothetical protein